MTPEKSASPSKATFRDNVVLTIKLLVVLVLLGAALWGVEVLMVAG